MIFFVTRRFYIALTGLIFLFLTAYFFAVLYVPTKILALILGISVVTDVLLLFATGGRVTADRICRDRFSNGDENEVVSRVQNLFRFPATIEIRDELPPQFQIRDMVITSSLSAGEKKQFDYTLRPMTRGAYSFGRINLLVTSPIGLIRRRIIENVGREVKVYPSFVRLHQYELMAISQQLYMHGQKRVRRVGNSQEFDTIRDYVPGDDPRHINWSATARKHHLMSNHYRDERSQSIYCVIDKGRAMKMPFEGMTLLDYAINASLVLSDISLKKSDKAGLLTFEDTIGTFVKAGSRSNQLHSLMEGLYRQETSFKESDFSMLFNFMFQSVSQRSLVMLFTNFESIHSLNRQLTYLRMINRKHLLIVVYFRNTEIDTLIGRQAKTTREIYDQAIGHQMLTEKQLIGEALNQAGILSLYTRPENLSVDIINKYIEVKTKRLL